MGLNLASAPFSAVVSPITSDDGSIEGYYGVADDSTDAQAETAGPVIQAMVDTLDNGNGGTVVLTVGSYILRETVTLYDNVRLTGMNVRGTFLKTGQLDPGTPAIHGADTHRNTVERLTIAGWDGESDGICLETGDSHPTYHTVRNVQAFNNRVAVTLDNCEDSRVERLTANGNAVNLRYRAPEGRAYIHDTRLADATRHSLELEALHAGVNASVITGTDSDALIYQSGPTAQHVTIRDCWFELQPTVYDTGGYRAGHLSLRDCYIVMGGENAVISGGARTLGFTNNTIHSKDGSAVAITDTQIRSAATENNHYHDGVTWGVPPRDS